MDWRIGAVLTVICFISILLNFGYKGEIKELQEKNDELWEKLIKLIEPEPKVND